MRLARSCCDSDPPLACIAKQAHPFPQHLTRGTLLFNRRSLAKQQRHQYGAKHYGYWVDAADAFMKPANAPADWKPRYPKGGDIVVLWDDVRNIRAHVCFVVTANEDAWSTAEGGGGTIPDQTASKNNKDVTWLKKVSISGRIYRREMSRRLAEQLPVNGSDTIGDDPRFKEQPAV